MSWPEHERETRREAGRYGRWLILWIVVAVVLTLGIGAAVWGLNVGSSGVRGQGDGIVKRNSAQNWLDAQTRFEQNYQEYESTLVRIEQFYDVHLEDPSDAIAKTNYLGQVSHCTDVVADYNADARDFLRSDFRAADLPASLDPTTCTIKETP